MLILINNSHHLFKYSYLYRDARQSFLRFLPEGEHILHEALSYSDSWRHVTAPQTKTSSPSNPQAGVGGGPSRPQDRGVTDLYSFCKITLHPLRAPWESWHQHVLFTNPHLDQAHWGKTTEGSFRLENWPSQPAFTSAP